MSRTNVIYSGQGVIKLLLFILLMLAGISLCPTIYAYELPDLGTPSETILTPKEKQQMSTEFMREVRRSMIIISDPIISDYIQNLGHRLVQHSDARNRKFHFFVVEDPRINAGTGPGENIIVFSGLILATRNESELAAVLSHEIAHVTQHHIERSIEQIKHLNIPMTAALVAAMIVGAGSGGAQMASAASGAAVSAIAGGTQHMINFTRENEAEADRIGMQTLYNANFDPEAAPTFFAHMQHLSLHYRDNPPPFLLTHPVTNQRIADAENRVTQYAKKPVPSDRLYYLIQARLQYIAFNNNLVALNYFKSQLNDKTSNKNASQYGYVLALLNDHQIKIANDNIDVLIKNDPREVIFQMAKAQIQLAAKQTEAALATLKNAMAVNPKYQPLVTQYAQTLVAAKQPEAAQNVIKQALSQNADQPYLYNLLATSQSQSHQLADAYISRAQYLEANGSYKQARILLQQALQLPKLSTNIKATIEANISRLKAKEKEQS